jgi:type I restriction enzyme S subunit
MSNNNENKLVPRLRFPEFAEAWNKELLGNIAKDITTGKLDANAMTENGEYRFYTCAKNYFKIDKYAFDKEALLIAGNGAYLGYIHYYKGKFNAYQRTYVLSDFTHNAIYLKYFLERFLPARINREKKDGNTPYIVLGTLTEMEIFVPRSPTEQQKIAACLSSLDEVITAEGKKLEALKEHKKGLLQNLFPQEGETVPKLRFKEFEDSGEWEKKEISEVIVESRISSNQNSPDKRITVRLNLMGIEKREVRGTEVKDATKFFIRKKGQFIYGKQNLHKGAFGIIPEELDGFESSQDIPAFDFKEGFDSKYFVYYLSQESVYPELEKISTGTGSKRIHPRDFLKILFPFPELTEQQKIADCLSSLDELIAAQTQKIELLQLHKKGLLQGLFPNINEQNG